MANKMLATRFNYLVLLLKVCSILVWSIGLSFIVFLSFILLGGAVSLWKGDINLIFQVYIFLFTLFFLMLAVNVINIPFFLVNILLNVILTRFSRNKLKNNSQQQQFILYLSASIGYALLFAVFIPLFSSCDNDHMCSGGEPFSGSALLMFLLISHIVGLLPLQWLITKVIKSGV